MKFTVSYSRKVKAGLAYEMLEIFASAESDDSIASMQDVLDRCKYFVEENLERERDRLLEKSVKRPAVEKEGDVHE